MSAPRRLGRRRAELPALPGRQRGIALLVAILLVALGTIVAASIAYENAMTARRGASTFAMDQSVLIAEAAEALAAYGLREVARADQNHTYIGQGWDKPVGPIEVVPDVMLTASLEDLQGRFNINSLVNSDGSPNQANIVAFEQLLASLAIEPKWANYVVDWIDPDIVPSNPEGAEDSVYLGQAPPYRTANLYITSTTELLALPGFGHERYQKLEPFISALPNGTALNVCTAPGKVLDAFTPGRQEYGIGNGESLAKNRQAAGACFPTMDLFRGAFANQPQGGQGPQLTEKSSYFKLTSFVTIGTTEFNLYSVLYQEPGQGTVRPLLRSYTPD